MLLYTEVLNKKLVRNATLLLLGMDVPAEWISFEEVEDHTVLIISDVTIGNIYLDEMDDLDDIQYLVEELVEEQQSRIREVLVQSRTEVLEGELQDVLKQLEKWCNKYVSDPENQIYVSIDHEWGMDGHWQMEEEYLEGYPNFVINVTNLDDFIHHIPVNLTESNAPEAPDMEAIQLELKRLLDDLN